MKKLLFLFLFANLNNAFAQNYTPLPDSGATWVNYVYWFPGPPDWPYEQYLTEINNYCVNGEDTIIATNTYTKINYCNGGYKGAFRDSVGFVFYVDKDSLYESLLYNFNLNVGDTLVKPFSEFYFIDTLYVENVDSILINGDYRTVIRFENHSGVWTEGFGSSTGLFEHPAYNDNVSGGYAEMKCFSHNDTTYYPDGSSTSFNAGASCVLHYLESNQEISTQPEITLYPNPTRDFVQIKAVGLAELQQLKLTTILGETVLVPITLSNSQADLDLSRLPNGIYFLIMDIDGNRYSNRIVKE